MKLEGVGVGIVGPPRSGTSSAALFLERVGFYLGAAEDIGAADEFNPDGYREHRMINRLNMETDWMFLLPGETHTPLPQAWEQHPLAYKIVERTRGVLSSTFGGASLWAWKDPRTTRILPIYQRALKGTNVGYLAMVRRPGPCARSIARRDGTTLDIGLGVWIEYTLCALKYLQGCACRFVHEAEWLNDPSRPVMDLMEVMGVDPALLALDEAFGVVRSDLRSRDGEGPANLEFAQRCYEVAYEAAVRPAVYLGGGLSDQISELWDEWQTWRLLRNSRRDRIELKLITDREIVDLFSCQSGPPWKSVKMTFEAKDVSLGIQPPGISLFVRSATITSSKGREYALGFGPTKCASCGWSPDGICRICPWTHEGVPILLPHSGSYTLEMEVQAYPTTTSAIAEALSSR